MKRLFKNGILAILEANKDARKLMLSSVLYITLVQVGHIPISQ